MQLSIRKQSILLPHLLFWLGFMVYNAMSFGWEDTDQLTFHIVPQTLVSLVTTMLATYINLWGAMPLYYARRQYVSYAVAILVTIFGCALLGRALTHLLVLPWEQLHDPQRYAQENKQFWIPVRILRIALQYIPVLAITTLLQLMRERWQQEQRLRQAEQARFQAEVSLLKAQINPHFFFNALNSLYALTLKTAPKAASMTLQLADLMHYTLYEASAEQVTLQQELAHLDNYVAIAQLRFADRLELTYHTHADAPDQCIAPMLLQPFIENAFKHGVEEGEGWITIEITERNGVLDMKVANSYKPAPKKSGIGLENVKRRLELAYPERHVLTILQTDHTFDVHLNLYL